MITSEVAAIIAIGISILAMIISLVTSINNHRTKLYELTSMQRSELISWYSDVAGLLVSLRYDIKHINGDNRMSENLTRLSMLIDVGRFYFPNIIKNTDYGKEKPSAFRGNRDVALDLLVLYYDIAQRQDVVVYAKHLTYVQRLFTSRVFDVLQPRKFNELTQRYTPLAFDEKFNLGDILRSEPEAIFSLYAEAKNRTHAMPRKEV